MALLTLSASAFERRLARQYPLELTEETPDRAVKRHEAVAKRRAGPVIIARRGAADVQPENSLEAFGAAVDFGADGCEVDLRRTQDGVLVLFHDDTLDRLIDGYGRVRDLTYVELSALTVRFIRGTPLGAPPPTFAALLELARDRDMLLHLNLRESGMDTEVAEWLDAADLWDHIVMVGPANGLAILQNPHYRPLVYKTPSLLENREDLDPASVKQSLAAPGDMLLVGDPRVAARELERKRLFPIPFTRSFQMVTVGAYGAEDDQREGAAMRWLWLLGGGIRSGEEKTLLLLATGPLVGTNLHYGRLSTNEAHVLQVAWSCARLGEFTRPDSGRTRVLKEVLNRPSRQGLDPAYAGVERASAARALARGGDVTLVPELTALLEKEPRFQKSTNQAADLAALQAGYRLRREVLIALGDLPCRASRRFLKRYVEGKSPAMDPQVPLFEEAARSLLAQPLTWDELAKLLRSENGSVRALTLFLCLDRPTEERRKALRAVMPWAMSLPGSRL